MPFWKKINSTKKQIHIQKTLGKNVNFSHDASLDTLALLKKLSEEHETIL